MGFKFRIFLLYLKKDLFFFFSQKANFWAILLFTAGYLTFFRLSLPPEDLPLPVQLSLTLAAHLGGAVFLLLFGQNSEKEWNAIAYTFLLGISALFHYFVKLIANFIVLFVLWIFLSLIGFFLNALPNFFLYLKTVLLTGILFSLPLAALGNLSAALSWHSRFRELMIFLIFTPLVIPIAIAASSFFRLYQETETFGREGFFLMADFFLFFSLGVVFYEYLVTD